MKKLLNIHPGEVLMEEFLIPMEISSYRLAKEIGIPQTRVSEITKGRRRITADTALRLVHTLATVLSSGLACRMIMILNKKGS